MLKRFFMVLALSVALGITPALAQQPAASPSPKPPVTIFSYEKELGLSADQVSKMKARLQALQASVSSNREKLKALEKEYETMLGNDTTPLPTIEEKLKEIAAVQVAARMEDLKASREILAILTPEQVKKWRGIQAAAKAQGSN